MTLPNSAHVVLSVTGTACTLSHQVAISSWVDMWVGVTALHPPWPPPIAYTGWFSAVSSMRVFSSQSCWKITVHKMPVMGFSLCCKASTSDTCTVCLDAGLALCVFLQALWNWGMTPRRLPRVHAHFPTTVYCYKTSWWRNCQPHLPPGDGILPTWIYSLGGTWPSLLTS